MQLKLLLLVFTVAIAVQAGDLGRLVSTSGGLTLKATPKLGIYDGNATTIQQHPYLVVIVYDGFLFGTGTIVSKRWFVGGAVLHALNYELVVIIAGSTDGTTGKKHTLSQVVMNPKYDGEFDYNIACAQIKGSFKWSAKVKPIKLATKQPKPNTPMVVAGYGATNTSEKQSNGALYEGTMYWLSPQTCETDLAPYSLTWTSRMACTYNKGKTTCCDGDWYSPFVHKKLFYGFLIGMVESTWCSAEAVPDLLTNVPRLASWIKKTAGAKTEDD